MAEDRVAVDHVRAQHELVAGLNELKRHRRDLQWTG
jgi:hypothetical protein